MSKRKKVSCPQITDLGRICPRKGVVITAEKTKVKSVTATQRHGPTRRNERLQEWGLSRTQNDTSAQEVNKLSRKKERRNRDEIEEGRGTKKTRLKIQAKEEPRGMRSRRRACR